MCDLGNMGHLIKFITPFKHVSAAIHFSASLFFMCVQAANCFRCSCKHKCGRYRNAFNMREVITHAQPSSGTFGPYVRSNAVCFMRLLHIVDNITCICLC